MPDVNIENRADGVFIFAQCSENVAEQVFHLEEKMLQLKKKTFKYSTQLSQRR